MRSVQHRGTAVSRLLVSAFVLSLPAARLAAQGAEPVPDIDPTAAATGEIVVVRGGSIAGPAAALRVLSLDGGRSIPLRVIGTRPGEIVTRVGPVPEGAIAGPVLVALGEPREPALPVAEAGLAVGSATGWRGVIDDASVDVTASFFTPRPSSPPAGREWIFSARPEDGILRLALSRGWRAGTVLELDVSAGNARDGEAIELRAGRVGISEELPLPEAAGRLCALVRALVDALELPPLECAVEREDADGVVLAFTLPGRLIDLGRVTLVVAPPPVDPPPVDIGDVFPRAARVGEPVEITGRGFGDDPDDICVVVANGGRSIPMHAVSATDEVLLAQLGPVPPDAVPGPIMVALGEGSRGFFQPFFDELILERPAWVWVKSPGGPVAVFGDGDAGDGGGAGGPGSFSPVPSEPSPSTQWFFSGLPVDGGLVLTLEGDWLGGSVLDVQARVHNLALGIGYDMRAPAVRLPGRGSTYGCALRICDIVTSAFAQQAGVEVECSAVELSNDVARVTLTLPGIPVTFGNLNVCVTIGDPPRDGTPPGDCNTDGAIDISDSLCLLGNLFLGSPVDLPCGVAGQPEPDAADVLLLDYNGDQGIDVSDAVGQITYLFLGGPEHVLGTACLSIPTCPKTCGF